METPLQTVTRLIGVIESLSDQESAALRAESWSELASIQNRSSVVLEGLLATVAALGGPRRLPSPLLSRLEAIARDCDARAVALDEQLSSARHELGELNLSRQKLTRFRPAYLPASRVTGSRTFSGQA